jgi:anti-anti-sigma factor
MWYLEQINMSNNDIIPFFDSKTDKTLQIQLESTQKIPDGIIIHLEGILETFNSLFFQEQMNKVLDAGFKNLIICGEKLNYVTSTGIGNFIFIYRQIKMIGGNIILSQIKPNILEVLKLLGFSNFFSITETITEAYAELNKNNQFTIFAKAFPFAFSCPMCKANLRAPHIGKYKCTSCKSTITLNKEMF